MSSHENLLPPQCGEIEKDVQPVLPVLYGLYRLHSLKPSWFQAQPVQTKLCLGGRSSALTVTEAGSNTGKTDASSCTGTKIMG